MGKKDFRNVASKQVQREQSAAKMQASRFTTAMQALGASPMTESVALLPLDRITDRTKNIREVDTRQACERAVAIAEHGLLQNLVVDRSGRLIAGAHRRWALALLKEVSGDVAYAKKKLLEFMPPAANQTPEQKKSFDRWLNEAAAQVAGGWEKHGFARGIEVKSLDFSADAEPSRAVAAEIVENTGRASFSGKDIKSAWERLREVGFTDVKGRPKTGELPIWPAMELMFGAHRKTLKKLLEGPADKASDGGADLDDGIAASLEALATRLGVSITVKPKADGSGSFTVGYPSAAVLKAFFTAFEASKP